VKRSDLIDRVWAIVGWPGYSPQSRLIPPVVAAGVARVAGRRAAAWQLVAWGVVPLGGLIKRAVGRPRPPSAWLQVPAGRAKGPSFPSTHVSLYTACFGFTAVVLAGRRGAVRWLTVVPVGLIALVGRSRVHEGDHWGSDVVGGYVLGGSYLAAVLMLRRRIERHLLRRRIERQRSARARRPPPTTSKASIG
jgi:undecaprenyl-diphosphatase